LEEQTVDIYLFIIFWTLALSQLSCCIFIPLWQTRDPFIATRFVQVLSNYHAFMLRQFWSLAAVSYRLVPVW